MRRAIADLYAENFWFWEALCIRIAGSVADLEALLDAPLPFVARWYIKQATAF